MNKTELLAALPISDPRILCAFERVPREQFVPELFRDRAYENRPLPIGHDQTISQPLVIAEMLNLAKCEPDSRALDVGTGSGYQAALMAQLVGEVYSIEIVEPLLELARRRLDELGYHNVHIRLGDGSQGWAEHAPYDVIIAAAAPHSVPQPLVDQLAPGGRLVLPVGPAHRQHLLLIEKQANGTLRESSAGPVSFVPLVDGPPPA